jgi:translation initiation factor 2B subunit (eIF-2B alpha/beta/delta family)
VSARDKIRADESFSPETRPATDLYDGRAPVSVANPAFDRTPADLVDGVATEDGLLDHEAIRDVAAQHREYATWDSESDR